jgi:hypothetical protein
MSYRLNYPISQLQASAGRRGQHRTTYVGLMHRCVFSVARSVSLLFLIAVLTMILASPGSLAAQQQPHSITVAIFYDGPVPSPLWSALVDALRSELATGEPEVQALVPQGSDAASIQILRGDSIAPGISIEKVITVFLHGDCVTDPAIRSPFYDKHAISGTLGWVRLEHSHIEPFIHVECDHIAQVIRPAAYNRNRDEHDRLMAVPVARVILHEWIHVASQNPHHAHSGIGRAEFTVDDLVGRPHTHVAQAMRKGPSPPNAAHGR